MATCFVIQPFDGGRFDKRYVQVLVPAIKAAGLEPYRVDKDHRVEVPIESIEAGIQAARVCLADITTDNPNVWYELGFAFASGTPVVMVCADQREGKKFPFDIQHRTVIQYLTDGPEDFTALQNSISERLLALLEKDETIRELARSEPVAPVAGLSQTEMTVLATLAGSVGTPEGNTSTYSLQQDSERAGVTKLGVALSLRRLATKQFIEKGQVEDHNGEPYDVLSLTNAGWDWIEANEDKFVLRKPQPSVRHVAAFVTDDDIPF